MPHPVSGAHKFPALGTTIIEFEIVNWGRRSAPSLMQTEVYIDGDEGGPDFVVVADAFLFGLTTGFTGVMRSAILPLAAVGPFVADLALRENLGPTTKKVDPTGNRSAGRR